MKNKVRFDAYPIGKKFKWNRTKYQKVSNEYAVGINNPDEKVAFYEARNVIPIEE